MRTDRLITRAGSEDAAGDFVRFESAHPDRNGAHVGVFGLVNVLGRHGMLDGAEEAWRREANAWYDRAYPDPGQVAPSIYDHAVHPVTEAWFKSAATHLIQRVPPYLAVLDAHHVAWRERRSAAPGQVLYEDACQVIVVPRQVR